MNRFLYELLNNEKKKAERLANRAEKELKRLPDGILEARLTKKKYPQYVRVKTVNGKREAKYITKKNHKLAEQLAQKSYDRKLMNAAAQVAAALGKAAETIKEFDPERVFQKESKIRQSLIVPYVPTDEQFIEQWYEEHPAGQNSITMSMNYTTLRGETVRSKSEKMIADTYYTEGIPYVYEPTLLLGNGKKVYPDFAVLNVRERKTFYHEHFGMMDDEDYRLRTIVKTREYNSYGFWPGRNMIYTFEGELIPFDQNELGRIIREFLDE